ncbi:MAG: fructose 1,6-bisphosphatase [Thaumarchaeota archaeon]|nr:fructose 1,6-bisphosphatase [Nitrososphaerota archaeon]
MKGTEWEKILLAATERVRQRVSPLAKREGRGRTVGTGAAGDRTIFADKLAEDELLKAITKIEGVRVLSEEAGAVGDRGHTLAVVDPLDGSSNFERGIPFYCTSVAIVDGDSIEDVTLGVVRDLVTGDAYVGRRGGGATKNGKRIRTSKTVEPAHAVVGVDLSRSPPGLVSGLAPLVAGVKRQVHLGANALELCYLAEGRVDSFIDLRGRIRITDFAAAYLIAKEAGAEFTGPDGKELKPEFDLKHRFSFVASANATIHKEILELCKEAAPRGS